MPAVHHASWMDAADTTGLPKALNNTALNHNTDKVVGNTKK